MLAQAHRRSIAGNEFVTICGWTRLRAAASVNATMIIRTIKSHAAPFVLLLLSLLAPTAHGHTLGQGYVFINIADETISGTIEITLNDLDRVLSLDADRDGVISDAEFAANADVVRRYVQERVRIGPAGSDNVVRLGAHELLFLDAAKYVSIAYDSAPFDVRQDLLVSYDLVFEADPSHRGFLVVQTNAVTGEQWEGEGEEMLIFTPDGKERVLPVDGIPVWSSFVDFLVHGVWHIWIGIDHILFLIALVLPAVLVWQSGRWRPVEELRSTLWAVVKIVTLFTIAHTITLTLATLSIVQLPSRLVESVIAASVAFAALNNVYPVLKRGIGYVVFGFGLFHGFGFASVLQDLIVSPRTLAVDLLAFNLGVEIGQIAIVIVVVPVLHLLRTQRFYVPVMLKSLSVVICGLSVAWLLERSLDVTLFA